MSLARIVFVLVLFLVGLVSAEPHNIAGEAKVTASSVKDSAHPAGAVTDGVISVDDQGEWACEKETTFWGYIRYPWVQLDWDEPRSVSKVVLYDRPILSEHSAGAWLKFSDGSEISVNAIPNDGTAMVVEFPAKKVSWIRCQVADGVGGHLGFSEIEVYPAPSDYEDLVSWVNPFIETTRGRYFYFTPGSRPFGMIATGPHTRNKNQWGGGYNYNSLEILGFGQVHGWMLSGIDVMPTTGSVDPTGGQQAWKSTFSHDDEIAQPGYQRVFLRDYQTWVELTSTNRVGLYRFRYTKESVADILINLGGYLGNSTMSDCRVRKVSEHSLEGSFASTGRLWGGPDKVRVFFVMEFDRDFQSLDGWVGEKRLSDVTELVGSDELTRRESQTFGDVTQSYWDAPLAGVAARYQVIPGDLVQMKVAISYTSVENARKNMLAECDHWDFERVKSDAQSEWNDWLGKITVEGGTDRQTIKFYTDLWHVLLGRHILDDVSGDYPDYTQGKRDWKFTDGSVKVRTLPRDEDGQVVHHMYNSDALWLTQWNVNVLWGLAWPEVLDDFSASMVRYADNGGLLPRGPCAGGYSYIMTGCPSTNMIVSAFMKGMLTKVDPLHAFEVMKRNHLPGGMMEQFQQEGDLEFYIRNGYCPDNAGVTVEWAFQDWSLSQMAQKLGLTEDEEEFERRSKGWTKLYRPDQKLLFPKKRDGGWLHNDALSGQGWIEANAWQGTWSISHGVGRLAELMGGQATLCKHLNSAFEKADEEDFVFGYGAGYVSYANQPGCSNAHVFNYAGQPWLSQYWVRKVNEQAYGAITPDKGYGGHDEDQGQMGGVSALMSMGLFSLKGNNSTDPVYELTSPVFDQVTIQLDRSYYPGRTFTIKTYDNSEQNLYIQRAKLNGQTLETFWFPHAEYAKGGVLELWMGSEPNKEWGLP
jgi:predicted alpha-1,2-mannosidase